MTLRVQDLERMSFEEFFSNIPMSFCISETKKNWSTFGRFIYIVLWKDEFSESDDQKFYAKLLENKKERWISRIETREETWKDYEEAILKIFRKMFRNKPIVWSIDEQNCYLNFERYNK